MAMMGSGFERRPEPEAPAGPRLRVYELAKDLNVSPKDLVNKVRAMGIEVANHMSHLESVDVDRVRRAVDRERLENLEEVRLNDTVIRRRSKSAAGTAAARPAAPAPAAAAPPPPPAAPAPAPRAPEPPPPKPVVARSRRPSRPRASPRSSSVPSRRSRSLRRPSLPPSRRRRRRRRPWPQPRPRSPSPPRPRRRRAPPKPVLKTIPQPVVTGSAATGAFIQLPGVPRPGEQPVQRFEIKDRDEELRRLGRGAPIMRQPAGARNQFGRPGFGPGGRPGGIPKKRVAAAGKKLKQTQITTPAEHKRVIRMSDTIAGRRAGEEDGRQGREIIKKLWALGMMEANINKDIDLDTATLIATEFGYQIESTAFREDELLDAPRRPRTRGSGPARAGRSPSWARRPRQDVAARRDPQGERRGGEAGRHHAAHRRLQGDERARATSCSWIRPATRRSPPCARAAPR
jgi:translation initiation factor IF-2